MDVFASIDNHVVIDLIKETHWYRYCVGPIV